MEEVLLHYMYDLPSQKKIKELTITKDMIEKKATTALEVVRELDEAA